METKRSTGGTRWLRSMDPFSLLPEGCIEDILSYTSPRDVCRSLAISPAFKTAAVSDTVWERFFPPGYQEIISNSTSPAPLFATKKQLYLSLADNPLVLAGGRMSFALDKESGKKCYMVGAGGLMIAWIDTPAYWQWMPSPQSRFTEVARLVNVWWLDIRGIINTRLLSPKTSYVGYLVFNIAQENHGLDTAATATVRCPRKGRDDDVEVLTSTTAVYLESPRVAGLNDRFPIRRDDGWLEIELGEFFNDQGDEGEVEMRYLEPKAYKSGLLVEGIEFRPKANI